MYLLLNDTTRLRKIIKLHVNESKTLVGLTTKQVTVIFSPLIKKLSMKMN